MSRKSDVIHIFPKFLTFLFNQFHTHVKITQSDDGGEFINHTLKTYFASKGIVHQLFCPGTPEQNGFADRHHHHIVGTALMLMAHSSIIPQKLWTAAFQIAVFLINRFPTLALAGKSPFQLVFESPPSYKMLKVFGCVLSLSLLLGGPNLILSPHPVSYLDILLLTKATGVWPCIMVGYISQDMLYLMKKSFLLFHSRCMSNTVTLGSRLTLF